MAELTRLSERDFETPAGTRVALVVTPTTRIVAGRERLEELRREHYTGASLDREVLAHARSRAGQDQMIVFRGRSDDGSGSWTMAADLSDDERDELGYRLVRDQLATYRRLVAAGVFALVHSDWDPPAVDAYISGTQRLLRELESESIPEVDAPDAEAVVIDRVDRWLLTHLTLFYAEPIDDVLSRVLAKQIPLLEQRVPALREMANALPDHAIG